MKNAQYELQRVCPICGEKAGEVLCQIELSPMPGEMLPSVFFVVSCCNCGFVFDDMRSSQSAFDSYYEKSLKYQTIGTLGSGGFSQCDMERYSNLFKLLDSDIEPQMKILDVGAGKCGLLKFLHSREFTQLTAVEPSMQKSDNAIEIYHSLDEFDGQFDFIFCTQVLEHVFDLRAFLQKILRKSHSDTIFYFEVPDAEKYLSSYRAPFHLFDREHINHFTIQSLKNLGIAFNIFPYKSHFFNYVYENVGCFFRKNGHGSIFFDGSGKEAIKNYITYSAERDTLSHLVNATPPIIVWGFGAYFRRIYCKEDFPKNISAIIDREQGKSGKVWNNIPFFTSDILKTSEYAQSTVIITAALYAEEIKRELQEMGFKGKVLTAFS